MPEVIGVSFRRAGKLHLFLCGDIEASAGDVVVAETKRGLELGRVSKGRHWIGDKEGDGAPRKILRVATKRDLEDQTANEQRAVEALEVCTRKIQEHGLPMRLIDAEYTLDRSRITFYFTAETRVDFRQLLRDLYAAFKTRIQLLQVGVRDEAKMLGGVGSCGRQLCCCSFLRGFDPVAIKMAKTQGLSLNPSKISGVCGRLMCCLRYEDEWYGAAMASLPRVGSTVHTERGTGRVRDVNAVKGTVTVQVEDSSPFEVLASELLAEGQPSPAPPPEKPVAPERPAPPRAPFERDAATRPAARLRSAAEGRSRSEAPPARGMRTRPQPPPAAPQGQRRQGPQAPPGVRSEASPAAGAQSGRRSRRSRRRGPQTQFRTKRKGTDEPPSTP